MAPTRELQGVPQDLHDTKDMCSWIFTDILGRTHVCDQDEGHYDTRPHDCHCGYTDDAGWNEDDHVKES
jgi:hypothetical protein